MNTLELVEIGDSLGLIFSEELLQRLKVGAGDTVFLTETARGFTLTTVDPQDAVTGVASASPTRVDGPAKLGRTQNKK
jgi:hypothetical protein